MTQVLKRRHHLPDTTGRPRVTWSHDPSRVSQAGALTPLSTRGGGRQSCRSSAPWSGHAGLRVEGRASSEGSLRWPRRPHWLPSRHGLSVAGRSSSQARRGSRAGCGAEGKATQPARPAGWCALPVTARHEGLPARQQSTRSPGRAARRSAGGRQVVPAV